MKLQVKNIKKNYKDLKVLEDISLELNENEFVTILGLSGSGKSTILNIISGLHEPDSGEILIDGVPCTGKSGLVSYMYQKDLLLPWKSIIDNVSLPLAIKGMDREKARSFVKDLFPLFGLDGFEQSYPYQLSGGMRQRAALMRTYVSSNDVMLLDEPFGGLDAITRFKMHSWLINVLNNLKTSIIFITHDIEEAIILSDRIYVITERPSRVREVITVHLPKPRSLETTSTEEFIRLKRHIFELLG